MQKRILKLSGSSKTFFDNLLYFFEVLKNTGFINSFSECRFFFEIEQNKNALKISEFLSKNNIQPEFIAFSKNTLFNFHTKTPINDFSARVNLVFIPEESDFQLTESYSCLIDKLQNLIILTGTNYLSDVFKSLRVWSSILQDDTIIVI